LVFDILISIQALPLVLWQQGRRFFYLVSNTEKIRGYFFPAITQHYPTLLNIFAHLISLFATSSNNLLVFDHF
jgi:hypothetical protein